MRVPGHPAYEGPTEAVDCERPGDLEGFAAGLFAAMRKLDAEGVELVFVRRPGTGGLARAIDDRLRRAAAEMVE